MILRISFRLTPSGITTSRLNDKDISTSLLFEIMACLLVTSGLSSRRCFTLKDVFVPGVIAFTLDLNGEDRSALEVYFSELLKSVNGA